MRIGKLGNNNEIPNMIYINDQKWSGIFCQTVATYRHNAQTLARKNSKGKNQHYKDNKRNSQIPDSFPGVVLITDTGNKKSLEFQYFMKRILGAVSPKQTDFKRKLFRTTVSNIFTQSNEAFALIFLYNNYGSWLNTTKGTRKRKKFTDSKLGNMEGWSDGGQDLSKYLTLDKDNKDYKFYIK
eukprot:jgi/Psemu1/45981/gm1.45981_g